MKCYCNWCQGREDVHGPEAVQLHLDQIAAALAASPGRPALVLRDCEQEETMTASWQVGMPPALAQAEADELRERLAGSRDRPAIVVPAAGLFATGHIAGPDVTCGCPDCVREREPGEPPAASPDTTLDETWTAEFWRVLTEPYLLPDHELPRWGRPLPGCCINCWSRPVPARTRLCPDCQHLTGLGTAPSPAAGIPVIPVRKRDRLGRVTEITYRPACSHRGKAGSFIRDGRCRRCGQRARNLRRPDPLHARDVRRLVLGTGLLTLSVFFPHALGWLAIPGLFFLGLAVLGTRRRP